MKSRWRIAAAGALAAVLMVGLGSSPGMAQPRAHVYLLRGLMNVFSLGMDSLASELSKRGIYATVHNHSVWQSLADQAAAAYKAGREGPIILIGHSLGADAVMQMADYLDNKGVPVALLIPFDGTQSFPTPPNVGRLVNLTQRDYAYMRRGAGFHGSLTNVDVSSDPSIDHLNIDKSPRMHARAIAEVLAVVGSGHRLAVPTKPTTANHAPAGEDSTAVDGAAATSAPPKSGAGAINSTAAGPAAETGRTPVIALPERRGTGDADTAVTTGQIHKPGASPSKPDEAGNTAN